MPAHSFQAPTLIGCQIFKEQGIAKSVLPLVFPLIFPAFSYSPEAEKRDYEGVFYPCQISFHHFAKLFTHILQVTSPTKTMQDHEELTCHP
jgi:hypothetical protein